MSRRALHVPASSPGDKGASWVSAAKSRDWLQTLRPWSVFVGLGDRRPFSLPSLVDWELRAPRNIKTFLTNYAIIASVIMALLIVQHLALLLWAGFLGFCWSLSQSYACTADGTVHPKLAQYRVTPAHISGAFMAAIGIAVWFTVGMDLFAYLGIGQCIILGHATLRTPASNDEGGLFGAVDGMPSNAGAAFLHTSATEVPVV